MLLKHVSRTAAIRSLVVVMLSITLFSFSERIGGDSFSIYLNSKLLMHEYVMSEGKVKNISLAGAEAGDILKIQYSHCGKVGVQRTVSLQDGQSKILKSWSFSDKTSPSMEVGLKDLLPLTGNVQNLKLVYTSREIPDGKVLAGIVVTDQTKASLK